MGKGTRVTEQLIIELLCKGLPKIPQPFGVGDDAAIVNDTAICMDTMVEGVHFDDKLRPADIGWKLVAVNVSDIISMGHAPAWASLSVSLPKNIPFNWVQDFKDGLHLALENWKVNLLGGDTTRSPGPIVLSMTMGSHQNNHHIYRNGAKIGDTIWVTGYPGSACAGFLDPQNKIGLRHLRRPDPPAKFATLANENKLINAMMDISDGIHADLIKLCKSSGVGAEIWPKSLPIGPALRNAKEPLRCILSFGDDYELLFTTSPLKEKSLLDCAQKTQTVISKIGVINKKSLNQQQNLELKGSKWPTSYFSHFS